MENGRFFDLDDMPTNKVLTHLDALARWHTGTAEHMHGWLVAAIRAIGLLPTPVRRHFDDPYYRIGNSHFTPSADHRERLWRRLALHLDGEIEALLADRALVKGGGANLSDRPITLGERVSSICNELSEALVHGGEAVKIAAKLEQVGAGTDVKYDASQLRRLLARKRVPDWSRHRSDMYRLISHARCVSDNLHHLPVPD